MMKRKYWNGHLRLKPVFQKTVLPTPTYTTILINAHKKLFTRQTDIYNQTALNNITSPNSKLRTYSLVKNKPGTESYLNTISNTKYRVMLSKFRLSNHELMIEKGRHTGVIRTQRYCPMCHDQAIEDEIHFLITCPSFNAIRRDALDRFEIEILSHPILSNREKFVLIMEHPSASLAKYL